MFKMVLSYAYEEESLLVDLGDGHARRSHLTLGKQKLQTCTDTLTNK
jgi:hypothetical protein